MGLSLCGALWTRRSGTLPADGSFLCASQYCSLFVEAQHFEPTRVFLGSVPDDARGFNVPLLPIALGKIDYVR
jgi:hypothetical protein